MCTDKTTDKKEMEIDLLKIKAKFSLKTNTETNVGQVQRDVTVNKETIEQEETN